MKYCTLFRCALLFCSAFFLPSARAEGEIAVASTELVDIQSINPNIRVELKYATDDNFTGEVVYDFDRCFLLRLVAEHLSDVQKELEQEYGLGLKVWDGYRPMSAQWKFWELVPDERYVSNPAKKGRHTRATTVDVTLVDCEGKELLMPSAFDDFSERAHRDFADAPREAIQNRELLQKIMEKHGFIGLPTEWWHFDWHDYLSYEPLDFNP